MRRIVCLSAESADILYRLGVANRIVGVTTYAKLPARLRHLPRISGFSAANIKRICELTPDLVLGYSDVQAGMAAQLIQAGLNVLITHQTSLRKIEDTILLLGRIVGKNDVAHRVVRQFQTRIRKRESKIRPRIYFEEWPDPPIAGITWVSELIERAGGEDVFRELRGHKCARNRVVNDEEICRRHPDLVIASWCGKPVRMADLQHRFPFARCVSMDSSIILQPGPVLARGFRKLCQIVSARGANPPLASRRGVK